MDKRPRPEELQQVANEFEKMYSEAAKERPIPSRSVAEKAFLRMHYIFEMRLHEMSAQKKKILQNMIEMDPSKAESRIKMEEDAPHSYHDAASSPLAPSASQSSEDSPPPSEPPKHGRTLSGRLSTAIPLTFLPKPIQPPPRKGERSYLGEPLSFNKEEERLSVGKATKRVASTQTTGLSQPKAKRAKDGISSQWKSQIAEIVPAAPYLTQSASKSHRKRPRTTHLSTHKYERHSPKWPKTAASPPSSRNKQDKMQIDSELTYQDDYVELTELLVFDPARRRLPPFQRSKNQKVEMDLLWTIKWTLKNDRNRVVLQDKSGVLKRFMRRMKQHNG